MQRTDLRIGQKVRYKPGEGTTGYEDVMDEKGGVPGVILAFTVKRVRVCLTMGSRGVKSASVDPDSLVTE